MRTNFQTNLEHSIRVFSTPKIQPVHLELSFVFVDQVAYSWSRRWMLFAFVEKKEAWSLHSRRKGRFKFRIMERSLRLDRDLTSAFAEKSPWLIYSLAQPVFNHFFFKFVRSIFWVFLVWFEWFKRLSHMIFRGECFDVIINYCWTFVWGRFHPKRVALA